MFKPYSSLPYLFLRDGDDGGAGGGGGGDDVQERINQAVEEAVAGLKKTNADLKAEKTEARKQADALASHFEKIGGEEGIERLLSIRENLEKDEIGQLIADGKHDEAFEKRIDPVRKDYEKRIASYEQQLAERDEALQGANSRLHNTLLDVGIGKACDAAEVKDPGAREHARMLAERQFSYDPEIGQHVIKDDDGGIVYGKDGKSPKTMAEWIEEKREVPEYRIWWPQSQSAGLMNGSLPTNPDRRMEVLGKSTMNEYRAARKKMDGAAA